MRSPRSHTERALRIASAVLLLAYLCACDVVQRFVEPPVAPPSTPPVVTPPPPVVTPPPVVPPPTTPPPVTTPQPFPFPLPTTLPIPTTIPQPGASLLSTRPPPDASTLGAPPAGTTTAIGAMTMPFLEQEAAAIYQELMAHLPEARRARVQGVPFHVIDEMAEPNAAAGCATGTRAPLVFMTRAMLVMAAGVAETRAYDELGSTSQYESYAQIAVQAIRSGRPIPAVPADLVSGPLATDPRKLARQRHLYDQEIAFILGHELAHHYLGHTGCTPAATATEDQAEQLQRSLAQAVPPLEQPNEVAADMWGVTSVLETGHTRAGGAWSEEGALLSLDTFRHLMAMGDDIALLFLSTHPPSEIRAPIVLQVSSQWQPGREPMPMPQFDSQGVSIDLGTGTPLRIPIPIQLGQPQPPPR